MPSITTSGMYNQLFLPSMPQNLSPEVISLLKQRYFLPNENWRGLVNRVVKHICGDEDIKFQNIVFDLLHERVFLLNSPALVNSGTKTGGLMACFVVGPQEDTLEHHAEVLGDIAVVGKRGGGCGFTGTYIRAEGSPVAGSAHGYAYGPNAWAIQVSNYLNMITQGGFRKMALMYTLRSDHRDLASFINLKQVKDERFCYNFNQSVMAQDSWMREATENPESEAGVILRKLASNAWNNGEPGLLFHTTMNENTPYQTCGCRIEATNPCGEQPLPPYGSCNLASINLAHHRFHTAEGFDYEELANVAKILTRVLDNVGSKNVFPNDKFKAWYEDHRPIGIGIMGYADCILRLSFRYGSDEANTFLNKVMSTILESSQEASKALGLERGIPAHCGVVGRRNITLVSIAPTGSISFLAGCSFGIEPIFAPEYQRTDERGETYLFKHPERNNPVFMSSVNSDVDRMPTWRQHVDTQVAAQKGCDSAISKTINFPFTATVEDVYDAMVYAWKEGAKGITVYRDGSRQTQVLEVTEEDKKLRDCPNGVCEL